MIFKVYYDERSKFLFLFPCWRWVGWEFLEAKDMAEAWLKARGRVGAMGQQFRIKGIIGGFENWNQITQYRKTDC